MLPARIVQTDLIHKNKEVSDDFDPILAFQGMSWFMRTAISVAAVTQHVNHYTAEDGKTHIDIRQTVIGGFEASPENRILDWTDRTHSDKIFGELVGRSRYVQPKDLEEADVGGDKDWFAEGWDEDGEKVESWVNNEAAGWKALQIWGFAVIDETRYYVRKVLVTKGPKKMRARLAYNYAGTLSNDKDEDE